MILPYSFALLICPKHFVLDFTFTFSFKGKSLIYGHMASTLNALINSKSTVCNYYVPLFFYLGNVICKYNLKEGKIIKTLGSIAPTKNPLAFHRSGNYIAYITLTKLHIDACETNTTEIFDPFQTKKKTKAELVSVAFHPTSYTIATGTKDGRIFVLYNWRKKDAVAVKLHWHHTPVNDILFTNDGK